MKRENEIESEKILFFADSNSMTNKVKKMPQWKEQANRYSDDQIPLDLKFGKISTPPMVWAKTIGTSEASLLGC